jgi:hypothetical protein
MDTEGRSEDAARAGRRGRADAVQGSAEQLEQVPSLAHRPDGVFRAARTAPVGPAHAVDAATGAVACGIKTDGLDVLDQAREEAFFVEKYPRCVTAVVAAQR